MNIDNNTLLWLYNVINITIMTIIYNKYIINIKYIYILQYVNVSNNMLYTLNLHDDICQIYSTTAKEMVICYVLYKLQSLLIIN